MIQYIVEKGDSLWKIAKAYNISLDSLIAANPQIADPNFILTGSIINIPENSWQNWPMDNTAGTKNNTMPMSPRNTNHQTPATFRNQQMPGFGNQMPNYGNQMPNNQMPNNQMPGSGNQQMPNSNWPNMAGNLPMCDENGMRPCIYEAQEGETLEQIGNRYMVPLTRLLYYNLNYGKNEPLPAGTRVVIPEGNAQTQPMPTAYNRYRRR